MWTALTAAPLQRTLENNGNHPGRFEPERGAGPRAGVRWKEYSMTHRQRCSLTALFTVASLCMTFAPAPLPALAAQPAVSEDILSGTWRVSRTCLTHCVSPKPVLKVVHRL